MKLLAATGLVALSMTPVMAQDSLDENVFFFGGRFVEDFFWNTFNPFGVTYEDNFFAGFGYQHFIDTNDYFHFGLEAGIGLRIGESTSAELWGGGVFRGNSLEFSGINITPAVTIGMSAVTDTIGVETVRAGWQNTDAPIFFYLGPEISVSLDDHPEWEGFVRVQHRSGGFGIIARVDGSNALTAGLRYKF